MTDRRARAGDADAVRQATDASQVRGGLAIGMGRNKALRLAIRCARDSMPQLRLDLASGRGQEPGFWL